MKMRQLALELRGYPRPIAWTLSEVDRAVGDRDRHSMVVTALEEITRYLVLMQLARYSEYWAQDRRDEDVERRLADLRRPSFGHYVAALGSLDRFLANAEDPYSIGIGERRRVPAMLHFLAATGANTKRTSILGFLGKVVELRNRDKGHGYTDQRGARAITEHLQPALIELLNHVPVLVGRPLVWIEQIEYIREDRWIVTLLELMGTQRARRLPREVENPGKLEKGFLYMWDGDSAPLQMTPFLHLDQASNDEVVYVLASIAGEPGYQARGLKSSEHRPDQLMTQFEERAPFLLRAQPTVTTPRPPDAATFYRDAVEIALADGGVSGAEEQRLDAFRRRLGLAEGEAASIHAELGWDGTLAEDEAESTPAESGDARSSTGEWQKDAHRLLRAVETAILRAQPELREATTLDEEIGVATGELWVELGRTQGVSIWFPSRRGTRVRAAVGFYSTNESRDPVYRRARKKLENELTASKGWCSFTRESKAGGLSLETRRWYQLDELADPAAVSDVASVAAALIRAAQGALQDDGPTAPKPSGELPTPGAPVSSTVPDNFVLDPLVGKPRIEGSVWKARILWALEWARRHDPGPKSAANIAAILTANGVSVPGTNTARAFRVQHDDPRVTALVEQRDGQRYEITAKGRRALLELTRSA